MFYSILNATTTPYHLEPGLFNSTCKLWIKAFWWYMHWRSLDFRIEQATQRCRLDGNLTEESESENMSNSKMSTVITFLLFATSFVMNEAGPTTIFHVFTYWHGCRLQRKLCASCYQMDSNSGAVNTCFRDSKFISKEARFLKIVNLGLYTNNRKVSLLHQLFNLLRLLSICKLHYPVWTFSERVFKLASGQLKEWLKSTKSSHQHTREIK